ncbi:MAG TPA: hypothetical protein VMW38_24360 [Terriglobia bacterium]|nr:hypothetical protein [Terriglobia bacterium]
MTRRHAALLACFIVVLAKVAIAGEKVYVDCQGKVEVPAYSAPGGVEPIGNLVCGQEVYSLGKASGYTKIALPGNQFVYVISSFTRSDAATTIQSVPNAPVVIIEKPNPEILIQEQARTQSASSTPKATLDQAHRSQEIPASSTRYEPDATHSSTGSLVLRSRVAWKEGMEGADRYCSGGETIESLTVNGLTVSVSLRDTGWKMRSDVVITNNTDQWIDVHPEKFFLEVLGPKPKQLDYESLEKLTKSVNRRTQPAAFGIRLATGTATNTITTDSSTLGPFNGSMELGAYSKSTIGRLNGSCRSSQTSMAAVPDYYARRKADEDARTALQNAGKASGDPSQIVLRANTIMPTQQSSGAVYFERYKGKSPVILKITLRGTVIEFPF